MSATTIDLPSAIPNGTTARLSFRILAKTRNGTEFIVSIQAGGPTALYSVTASVESSTLVHGPPSILFDDLASNWCGWIGEKRWEDHDGTVQLIATYDRTGHVLLTVILRIYPYGEDRVQVTLLYEAGSLERISRLVSDLFDDHAT